MADRIGAVDALVGRADPGANTQQRSALGRPVARRPRAVFLAGQDHQRDAGLEVVDRRVVDAAYRRISLREIAGEAAFGARRQLVTQADVGESATDHHLVVDARSEEHTSELQSLMRTSYAVFRFNKKNNSRPNT